MWTLLIKVSRPGYRTYLPGDAVVKDTAAKMRKAKQRREKRQGTGRKIRMRSVGIFTDFLTVVSYVCVSTGAETESGPGFVFS